MDFVLPANYTVRVSLSESHLDLSIPLMI